MQINYWAIPSLGSVSPQQVPKAAINPTKTLTYMSQFKCPIPILKHPKSFNLSNKFVYKNLQEDPQSLSNTTLAVILEKHTHPIHQNPNFLRSKKLNYSYELKSW